MSRRSTLTVYSKRLTPVEVARHWFRRGAGFAPDIQKTYPDFPRPCPDGLFLLSQVERWFDRMASNSPVSAPPDTGEEEAAMRAARGG